MFNFNNQSIYANQYNKQQTNDMINKFKSEILNMDQNTLDNLINQAKNFGLSDSQINQGINIMNSMRRG